MKNSRNRLAGLVCLAASIGTSGCGGIFDITYLIGGKQYTETKEDRKGTGQSQAKIEVDGQVAPDGTITPTCVERERGIERSFTTARTYEYRAGYKREMYISATILSALTGGAIAGLTAYLCHIPPSAQNNFAQPMSCMNMLFAAPSAVDTVYSAIRIATAKTPKLVNKTKAENPLAYSNTAVRETPVTCDPTDSIFLGYLSGASDMEQLQGYATDKPKLSAGALPVQKTPTGGILLKTQPDVVNAWVSNPQWVLASVNRDGEARTVHTDRCFVLRSAMAVIQPNLITMFGQQCPMPPPPTR